MGAEGSERDELRLNRYHCHRGVERHFRRGLPRNDLLIRTPTVGAQSVGAEKFGTWHMHLERLRRTRPALPQRSRFTIEQAVWASSNACAVRRSVEAGCGFGDRFAYAIAFGAGVESGVVLHGHEEHAAQCPDRPALDYAFRELLSVRVVADVAQR